MGFQEELFQKRRRGFVVLKNVFLSGLFLVLLALLLGRLMYVCRDKRDNWRQDNFAQLPRDSVDVVFIGNSHQFCSVNTDLLYDEYGINGFMLATPAQTVPMSYYAAMEAIELQHPDVIVFEVLYCANDFRTVLPELSHAFFDGMPACRAKWEGIRDLIEEEERIYYHLNFGRYHSRWKSLTEEDFQSDLTSPRGSFFCDTIEPNWNIPVVPRGEKKEMPEEMLQYLEKMVELCRENDVRMVWYVAPFNALKDEEAFYEDVFERQRVFNWVEDYAQDQGIPFYNLFYEIDQIGFDWEKDFMDTQHLNCYGQEKLTRYMAERGYFGF